MYDKDYVNKTVKYFTKIKKLRSHLLYLEEALKNVKRDKKNYIESLLPGIFYSSG